jgi:hypothetical protein
MHVRARARKRIVESDDEDLRRFKMLMTMSCHLMHLCVQAKA